MKQILAIARREMSAFFQSAMAPVVISGFLVLTGLFFTLFVWGYSENSLVALRSGRPTYLNFTEGIFRPLVTDMTVFLLLLMPAVTMRLLSGELRSGRFDLIMSWPVPDRGWVLGKWLSALAVAATLILASGAYFAVVALLGKPEVAPVLVAALGLLLLASALAAWGVAFSGLFQYQILSYFVTFAFALGLFMGGAVDVHLPGLAGELLAQLSPSEHFGRFSRGVVDSRDLVYFVGLTATGLALATAILGARKRRHRAWAPAAIVLVAAVFAQAVAVRRPLTADLTPDARNSLAPQTRQVLELIDERVATPGVEILAFYQRLDPAWTGMNVLLRSLCDQSARVTYRQVDPEREPELLQAYGVTVARTVVVAIGERRLALLEPDEGKLVNMIYRLATGASPEVAYVLGHGEHLLMDEQRSAYSAFGRLLEENGYVVRPLVLPERAQVPASTDVVVLAGPKLDPSPAELAAVDAFLERGGSLLALLDPTTPPAVQEWARRYNVHLEGDVVVSPGREGDLVGVGLRTVVVVDGYSHHPIVRDMEGVATVFPLAQSLRAVQKDPAGIEGEIILYAAGSVWGERDPGTMFTGTPQFDAAVDRPSPLPIGVAAELATAQSATPAAPWQDASTDEASEPERMRQAAEREAREWAARHSLFGGGQRGRLVIIGNSEFASNANLELYGNRDLVLNLLNWLSQEEVLINVRARPSSFQPLALGDDRRALIGWICVVGWPAVAGGASLAVVLRRRRRP